MLHIKFISITHFVVFGFIMSASTIFAQNNGANGLNELLIPVGAENLGTNGANVSTSRGIDGLYTNPAGLAHNPANVEALFSKMNYFGDSQLYYLAVSNNFPEFGNLAMSLKLLEMGDIPVTTPNIGEVTGRTYSPLFMNFGITYAREFNNRIDAGISFIYLREEIDRIRFSKIVFDAGFQYRNLAGINGLNIGVCLKNMGMHFKLEERSHALLYNPVNNYEDVPTLLDLGISKKFSTQDHVGFELLLHYRSFAFSDDYTTLGAQFYFGPLFCIRTGYQIPSEPQKDQFGDQTHIYNLALGFGFGIPTKTGTILFDYAFRNVEHLESNNLFSLRFAF